MKVFSYLQAVAFNPLGRRRKMNLKKTLRRPSESLLCVQFMSCAQTGAFPVPTSFREFTNFVKKKFHFRNIQAEVL